MFIYKNVSKIVKKLEKMPKIPKNELKMKIK